MLLVLVTSPFAILDSKRITFSTDPLLQNPLPKCWSVDLSRGWAGTETDGGKIEKQIEFFPGHRLVATDGKTIVTSEMRARRVKLEDIHTRDQNFSVWLDPFTNVQWLE